MMKMLPGKKGSYQREQWKGSLALRIRKTLSNSLCTKRPTVKDFKNREIMRQEILDLPEGENCNRNRKS